MPNKFKINIPKWNYQDTIRQYKDTKNFEITKKTRFSNRIIQLFLSFVLYFWIGTQVNSFITAYHLEALQNFLISFSVLSPLCSIALILGKFIHKK
jgi:hypothetical protein